MFVDFRDEEGRGVGSGGRRERNIKWLSPIHIMLFISVSTIIVFNTILYSMTISPTAFTGLRPWSANCG